MDQPLGRIALVVRFKVPNKARFSVGGLETFKAGEKKNHCVYACTLASVSQSVCAVVSAYIPTTNRSVSEPILVPFIGYS